MAPGPSVAQPQLGQVLHDPAARQYRGYPYTACVFALPTAEVGSFAEAQRHKGKYSLPQDFPSEQNQSARANYCVLVLEPVPPAKRSVRSQNCAWQRQLV